MDRHQGSRLFLIVLFGSLILLARLFWTYFSAIILALVISSVFYPLYIWVRARLGGREQLSALIMTSLVIVILVGPVTWFVGTLSKEAYEFYRNTASDVSIKKIQEALQSDSLWAQRMRRASELAGFEWTPKRLEELAGQLGSKIGLFLYDQLSSMASNILSFLIHFFLMTLTVFYLFRDGVRLRDYLVDLIPVPKEQLEKLAHTFREMAKAMLVGNGLSGLTQGICGGLGFFFFGLSSPFLWGTIIAFVAFVPVVGAGAVFIPTAAILMIQGKTGTAIGFLIYNVLYSFAVEYGLKPKVIGKGMRMNSLLVFIGILGGMTLFGILGIIYGPLIITIFLTLAEIYRMEYKEKGL